MAEKSVQAGAAAGGAPPIGLKMITSVQLDGLVVLKIIKHCQENFPLTVTGQLLGMDVSETLEVTNCYPFPQIVTSAFGDDKASAEVDQSQYQMNMMRCVRDVNIDHQVVGWYQSSGNQIGSFLTLQWIETQFSYQDNLQNVVCLVYDPVQTEAGSVGVRAFRLSAKFMSLFKQSDFSSLGFSRFDLDSSSIIEELPVDLRMSSLQKTYLADLFCGPSFTGEKCVDFSRLSLPKQSTVEQTIEFMINDFEELNREQNKYSYFARSNAARANAVYQEMQRKRRASKDGKDDGRGEMEQLSMIMQAETPRLDSKILIRELSQYVDRLSTLSVETVVKENSIASLQPEQ